MTGPRTREPGSPPPPGDDRRQARAPQYRQILRPRRPSAIFAEPARSGDGTPDVGSPAAGQERS